GLFRIARVTANISRPRACAHQLPRIGSPAMAAASEGTGPVPDSNASPCAHTKASASAGVMSDSPWVSLVSRWHRKNAEHRVKGLHAHRRLARQEVRAATERTLASGG